MATKDEILQAIKRLEVKVESQTDQCQRVEDQLQGVTDHLQSVTDWLQGVEDQAETSADLIQGIKLCGVCTAFIIGTTAFITSFVYFSPLETA